MPEEGNNVHGICTPSKYMHKLSMSLKEILSVSPCQGPKNDLTFYVCSGLLEYCSSKSTCKLVVRTQRSWDRIGRVTFTWRADSTLIDHQVMCWKRLPQHICVWLPDTDVLILLLELVSWGHLGSHPSQVVNWKRHKVPQSSCCGASVSGWSSHMLRAHLTPQLI